MTDNEIKRDELGRILPGGNKITKRDPETGRILPGGKILSSEEASEMGKKRWDKPIKESRDTLLQEAGYSNPEEAPEHLKVLAEMAVSQKSGSVAALRDFRKLNRIDREITPDYQPVTVLPGEICPTCNHPVIGKIKQETAKFILDAIDRASKATRADNN